jgi:hypothetical protein
MCVLTWPVPPFRAPLLFGAARCVVRVRCAGSSAGAGACLFGRSGLALGFGLRSTVRRPRRAHAAQHARPTAPPLFCARVESGRQRARVRYQACDAAYPSITVRRWASSERAERRSCWGRRRAATWRHWTQRSLRAPTSTAEAGCAAQPRRDARSRRAGAAVDAWRCVGRGRCVRRARRRTDGASPAAHGQEAALRDMSTGSDGDIERPTHRVQTLATAALRHLHRSVAAR